MDCPNCGGEVVAFAVPEGFASHLPEQSSAMAICVDCLNVVVAEESPEGPEFGRVSTHLPENPETAVPLVLAVGLLDHLALYREEITRLLEAVERAGTDPILVLERLAEDPSLEPNFDLERRVHQVIQLYE